MLAKPVSDIAQAAKKQKTAVDENDDIVAVSWDAAQIRRRIIEQLATKLERSLENLEYMQTVIYLFI